MGKSADKAVILGAGVTGLAAGVASGFPVYEARELPGGICSSYYMRPGEKERIPHMPRDEEVYRFEIGGGHWIFGGDSLVLQYIRRLSPVKRYTRRSAVYLPSERRLVPYPLQNHLAFLDREIAYKALTEMIHSLQHRTPVRTMDEWLRASFGQTLYSLFFGPFHELYTAGLFHEIAPQDPYKTPVNLDLVIKGAFTQPEAIGYNVTFVYPERGLDDLVARMAEKSQIHFDKRVTHIDVNDKVVHFADGETCTYDVLMTTLPLNRMMEFTGLSTDEDPDPSTAVLVVNIGARRGPRCPDEHWLYIPESRAGFHRVGFYSNVDESFIPRSYRGGKSHVSIYVEKAYRDRSKPGDAEVQRLCQEIVAELQEWEWIEDVDVVDPTWIDVAYTWSRPGSRWKEEAIRILESCAIYPVGRFARWKFQGIADSIRDGLLAGKVLREIVS